MRALALLAERAPDVAEASRAFVARACDAARALCASRPPGWDSDGFADICAQIALQLRRPGCAADLRPIAELARQLCRDEPAQEFAQVLEAAASLQCDGALECARIAIEALRVLPQYTGELAPVVRAFVCAHPGQLCAEFADAMVAALAGAVAEDGVCAAAKALAALFQSAQCEPGGALGIALEMIAVNGNDTVRGAGIEIVASAAAGGMAVGVPEWAFEAWREMIDRGRLATNYFRALTLAAFVALHAEEAFGERMMAMLNNQIQIDREFFANNRETLFDDPPMPILDGIAERFPGFVLGEE
jgi:hypothetical protein